jgi:hypothetical protein
MRTSIVRTETIRTVVHTIYYVISSRNDIPARRLVSRELYKPNRYLTQV